MSSLFELDIQNCKGVGPQRAKLFRKLGVPTVGICSGLPRAYEDWSQHCLIRDTTLNEVAVVKATVLRRPTEHRVKGGKLLYKTTVTDGDSDMALTFFNNKYIPTAAGGGNLPLPGEGHRHLPAAGDAGPGVPAPGKGRSPSSRCTRPRRGSPPGRLGRR